jgi:putative peptidoglycan lipid II flippase
VRQIASAAGVVGAATLASRVLGFVRDMAIAWLFGAGMAADAFFAAFRIPSTLRELLGEGALSAAFIPAFTRTAARDGRPAAWALASRVMGTLMVVLAAVTLIGMIAAPAIVAVLTPGFARTPAKLHLTADLLRIMFPYLFLVGLSALFMAILNSLGHFLVPALTPTMLNLAMIAVALVVAPRVEQPAVWLATSVVLGGAGQVLIQVRPALARGWPGTVHVAPRDPGVREVARLMLPGVGGLAVTQANVFVNTLLASLLADGSIAALTYAFRMVQFPIGVVGVAIATAALPVMAAANARGAPEEAKRSLQESLRLGLFLGIPATAGLLVFRVPIIHVLLERGAFDRSATLLAADILAGYSLGLGFYIANRILAPAFYAMQDTRTPVLTGALAVGINIAASLALMGWLGAAGLALATAVASCGNCMLLCLRLRRRIGPLGLRLLARRIARVALAGLPLAAWGILAQHRWDVLAVSGFAAKAALLGGHLAAGSGIFLGAAALLRYEELAWLRAALARRRRPAA